AFAQIDLAQKQYAQRPFGAEGAGIETLKRARVSPRFVSHRDDLYLLRRHILAKQCISGPLRIDDDSIRERAFAAPVVPVDFGRWLPLVIRCLLKIGNDSFLGRAGIDLAQDSAPTTRARKLEDLARRVTVGEDGVMAVSSALESRECLALKPLVSLVDQLPAVLTRDRSF